MEVPHIVEEEGIRGGGSNPGGLVVVDEGKHISRKEGLQVAPDPRYVILRSEGDGSDVLEGRSGSRSQVQRTPSKDRGVLCDGRGTSCDESSSHDEWRKSRPPPQSCG